MQNLRCMKKIYVLLFSGFATATSLFASAVADITDGLYTKIDYSITEKTDAKNINARVSRTAEGFVVGSNYFYATFRKLKYEITGIHNQNEDVKQIFGAGRFPIEINDYLDWTSFTGLGITYGSGGGHLRRNYDIELDSYLTYKHTPDWKFDFGVRYHKNKPSMVLYPIIDIEYRDQKQDGFSFRLGYPFTDANYRFNDTFAVGSAVKYIDGAYGYRGFYSSYFYLRDAYFTWDASLTTNFTENLYLKLGGGLNFYRRCHMYDEDGHDLMGKIELKNSGFGFATLGYDF